MFAVTDINRLLNMFLSRVSTATLMRDSHVAILSVRPSVRLPRFGNVSKRLHYIFFTIC